ncbi:YrhB domain-containing protein [Jiangella anatolica]|uniref:YrhB domain-containing protein n=1 Tax=Jiangella anatolica TaxID=2670374 RepID=UPI001314E6DB|nr:YrhB domain-containing protein [Jiangella anatolica]
MVLQDAFEAAQRFLDEVVRSENHAEIVIGTCSETDDGWAFGYNSRAFIEDGDISSSLAGNGPVIVPKSGAAPYMGSVFGGSFN